MNEKIEDAQYVNRILNEIRKNKGYDGNYPAKIYVTEEDKLIYDAQYLGLQKVNYLLIRYDEDRYKIADEDQEDLITRYNMYTYHKEQKNQKLIHVLMML